MADKSSKLIRGAVAVGAFTLAGLFGAAAIYYAAKGEPEAAGIYGAGAGFQYGLGKLGFEF
jgi:hypothetical protein